MASFSRRPNGPQRCAQLQALRAAAANSASEPLVRPDGDFKTPGEPRARQTYIPKLHSALRLVQKCLAQGEQAVVFRAYRDSLDVLAARLTESFSGGPLDSLSVTNGYDADGRRTRLAALKSLTPLIQQAFGYDAASRLLGVTNLNDNDSATYSYLANSPLVSQIAYEQNGSTRMITTKSYDYLNRLTRISSQPSASGLPPIAFNYSYNSANQRTQDLLADGSYWVYQYDSLGQVTNGCKYFYDHTSVPGQQFGYLFDDIGNRSQTQVGGDSTGGNQRVANYWVNNLNQITNRDFPGTKDIVGVALATNSVTVNGQPAFHKGEYFWGTVKTNNANAPAWLGTLVNSGGSSTTGNVYLAQTREQFKYDADGNLTNDGRWAYSWDAENRLVQMTVNALTGPQYQLTFAYDSKGRRVQKIVATNNGTAYIGQYTNKFLYDGWNLIAIVNPQSSISQKPARKGASLVSLDNLPGQGLCNR